MKYSVLMSVYYKEKAENLKVSMDSMWNQTVQPDEFVLVCDGPLTGELDAVILDMQSTYGERLKVVRLEKNMGLGNALNIGLKHCKNEIVARMDSDDISKPERCERQILRFEKNNDLDVISCNVEEFSENSKVIDGLRMVPESHQAILRFARKRNPFNHPAVMYRKSVVEKAGGYEEIFLLEDYYLWVRMLQNGAIAYNIQEPLLMMRAGKEMYRRRAGLKYIMAQIVLFKYMSKIGFITWFECFISAAIRCISSLAPNCLRTLFYKYVLRE